MNIVILNNLSGLSEHVNECTNEVVTKIKRYLDNQMVRGDKHKATIVLDQVENLHQTMKEMLMDLNVRSEGMIMENGLVGRNEEVRESDQGSMGGKIHNVPHDSKIPRVTLGTLITC